MILVLGAVIVLIARSDGRCPVCPTPVGGHSNQTIDPQFLTLPQTGRPAAD